jgi:site-specific recombinase XerC
MPGGTVIGSLEIIWRAVPTARLFWGYSALGMRDATTLSLLYGCGLLRAELVALDIGHYIKKESELIIRVKGNKRRTVPLGNAAPALADWPAILAA